ncbi:MAG: tetratricopeptide repeat protein [Polyangiaceae bacterium]
MAEGEDLFASALAALERGDTAGGITDLKAYLDEEPEDEDAWLTLGTAYAAIGHHADAVRALKEAVELDGDVLESRLAYGRSLARAGKLDDAAFQLLRANKLDPSDGRVLHELGVVFYDKRLFDKAEGFLAQAIDATTGGARARSKYAFGLTREAKKDIAGAIAAYRDAIDLDPRLIDARRTLADALAAIGEHERAVDELTRLLEVDRTNEEAAKNREVLIRALAEMQSQRLLGKTTRELEMSALVQEGQMKRKGRVPEEIPGTEVVRYARPLFELYVTFDGEKAIDAMALVVTDPARAAEEEDDVFRVTAIGADGKTRTTNLATATSITFLREALGCPMTTASALYGRLLAGESTVDWGGAVLAWKSLPPPEKPEETRHGLSVARKPPDAHRRLPVMN